MPFPGPASGCDKSTSIGKMLKFHQSLYEHWSGTKRETLSDDSDIVIIEH